jgi:hypothetical protein
MKSVLLVVAVCVLSSFAMAQGYKGPPPAYETYRPCHWKGDYKKGTLECTDRNLANTPQQNRGPNTTTVTILGVDCGQKAKSEAPNPNDCFKKAIVGAHLQAGTITIREGDFQISHQTFQFSKVWTDQNPYDVGDNDCTSKACYDDLERAKHEYDARHPNWRKERQREQREFDHTWQQHNPTGN